MNDREFARAHAKWLDPPDEQPVICAGCGKSVIETEEINGKEYCYECADKVEEQEE